MSTANKTTTVPGTKKTTTRKTVVKSADNNTSTPVPPEVKQQPVEVKKQPEVDLIDEEDSEIVVTPADKRKLPTKETVLQTFDDMIKSIEVELETLREGDSKNKGIKFLRILGKRIKNLKNQSARIIKQKKVSTKKNTNTNSGFLKPVQISGEMAKFTGWPANELKSRVDVTKYLCQYIRENNLQNPSDKRQIIADGKLQKLLKLDPKKDTEPLTYFRLQTQLKSHFVKPEIKA